MEPRNLYLSLNNHQQELINEDFSQINPIKFYKIAIKLHQKRANPDLMDIDDFMEVD